MLFLVFRLDNDRYALPAQEVVEVLPLVQLKQWPKAAEGIAGVCTYRGRPVPVLDLSELCLGRPAMRRMSPPGRPKGEYRSAQHEGTPMSTRLLVVRYPDAREPTRLLGLIAEDATDTVRIDPGDFVDAGVRTDGAPFLGPVVAEFGGLLQRVDVAVLLPPALRDTLFVEAEATWEVC